MASELGNIEDSAINSSTVLEVLLCRDGGCRDSDVRCALELYRGDSYKHPYVSIYLF